MDDHDGTSIISFSIPLLIGSLFQTLYNTVDSVIIGNFADTEALAAVGACHSPMLILLAVMMGLSGGTSILVSQYFGKGGMKKVGEAVASATSFFLFSVIPLTVGALVLIGPLLELINVPDASRHQAHLYLLVVFGGLIGNYGYNLNSGILRGLGDGRSPLLFLLIAFLVNIVLDLFFVLVLRWGVFGVAAATVIAQNVSWIYSIRHIKRNFKELNYRLFSCKVTWSHLREMLSLSLPLVINHGIFSLAFLFYYRFINGFGPVYMAGYAIAGKLENLTWLPISSLGTTAITFAGQNCGAGNLAGLKKGTRLILKTAIVINVVTAVATLLCGRRLLGFFTPDSAVIEAGYAYLSYLLPFYWIYTIIHILSSVMNGAGEVKAPAWISVVIFWCIRLPLAWYLSHHFSGNTLHISYPVSWVAGCALTVAYYWSGRWKQGFPSKASLHDEGKPPPDHDVDQAA